MIVVDVNVLVHAYREDAPRHRAFRTWLKNAVGGDESFGLADLILSRFVRVVTHPRVFSPPSPVAHALTFVQALRERPNCVHLTPGPRHWEIFAQLCRTARAKGNLVPDAYLAALVIETGNEWITTDRDYSRFPGLRWRHPLESD